MKMLALRKNHLWWVGAAALLALAGCTVPVAGTPAAVTGSTPTAAAATPGPAVSSSNDAPLIVKSVVPGWNTVRSTQRAALYDVPPAWTVKPEDTIVGFETHDGKLLVAASGSATVGEDACGKYTSLATSAVKHSTSGDLAQASTLEAQAWADAAFRDSNDQRPVLRTGQPESVDTLTGKPAVIVKVEATAPRALGNCGTEGAAYALSATGFTGKLGPTAILVIVAGAGFDRAIPEAEIKQVLTTLRPQS